MSVVAWQRLECLDYIDPVFFELWMNKNRITGLPRSIAPLLVLMEAFHKKLLLRESIPNRGLRRFRLVSLHAGIPADKISAQHIIQDAGPHL